MTIPYIVGRDAITVMVDGATHTVGRDHLNYQMIREAIRVKDWDTIPALLTPAAAVEAFGKGAIAIDNGEVLYEGVPLHNSVTSRIIEMTRDGFDVDPLINFLTKLMNNPSKTAVDELYDWLERTSLPITEDGDFLAYKKVKSNYMDFYTGKMDNSVGQEPSMPRNQVDDNRSRTCSQGLHFCSLSYLPKYHGGEGKVMIVKINPANVVSIPNDYDFAKGRAWTYKVIGEHDSETEEAFSTPVATNEGSPIRGNTAVSSSVTTTYMGINWIDPNRTVMVENMVKRLCNIRENGSLNRNETMARMDGFDDAWQRIPANLNRVQSGLVREALAYAQAYFAGYDRCASEQAVPAATPATVHSPADEFDYENQDQAEEIERVFKLTLLNRYHGRERGYSHGRADGLRARQEGANFDLYYAIEGGKGYRTGYIEGYLSGYNG